ncbi:DUF3501 family protein [Roseateles sp.]|uniref:DUF3501 family protein n=1 Tax=Roseateles sp. TaxID=1971397 RepID=UPI003D10D821
MSISAESLLSLEAYGEYRRAHQAEIQEYRRRRSLLLGEHMSLQFESEQTLRYQLQEVLLAERLVEPEDIERELSLYARLLPSGSNWRASLLIEFADPKQREVELPALQGAEQRFFVEVQGMERVYALANEDLPPVAPGAAPDKPSAVHFLRFEFSPAQRDALRIGTPANIGCEHPAYPVDEPIPASTLSSLVGDFQDTAI